MTRREMLQARLCRVPHCSLEALPNKMLVCGHRDYTEFCEDIKEKALEGLKQLRQEGGLDHGTVDTAEQAKQKSAESIS